ncbi:hypothetical protein HPB47_000497 [Ixodes persulcatus]|uniref:Uncharacterized protein n=1 Tax=Ixodes persulcatus TaxID=34615 RepID=A0AC60PRH6_IXOPE|nr:hypothetical protein HPB47_000497 [Ixodes persulcatus]
MEVSDQSLIREGFTGVARPYYIQNASRSWADDLGQGPSEHRCADVLNCMVTQVSRAVDKERLVGLLAAMKEPRQVFHHMAASFVGLRISLKAFDILAALSDRLQEQYPERRYRKRRATEQARHANFPGLVLMSQQPWLCCSPDGLMMVDGETVLVEMKCPETCQDCPILDRAESRCNVPYLAYREDARGPRALHARFFGPPPQVASPRPETSETQIFSACCCLDNAEPPLRCHGNQRSLELPALEATPSPRERAMRRPCQAEKPPLLNSQSGRWLWEWLHRGEPGSPVGHHSAGHPTRRVRPTAPAAPLGASRSSISPDNFSAIPTLQARQQTPRSISAGRRPSRQRGKVWHAGECTTPPVGLLPDPRFAPAGSPGCATRYAEARPELGRGSSGCLTATRQVPRGERSAGHVLC